MTMLTNKTSGPKAVITVDGPIILKAGESCDVSKYNLTDDYVGLLEAAGVSMSAPAPAPKVEKPKAQKSKAKAEKKASRPTITLGSKD